MNFEMRITKVKFMRTFLPLFMFIAGAGFCLSLIAHLLALFGVAMSGGGIVWMLHVGIFVVWIPAILASKGKLRGIQRKDHMEAMMRDCPRWMRRAVTIIFVYALLNFALFMLSTAGHAKPHGAAPPSVIRGFSGHWMLFYSMAFAIFRSLLKSADCRRGTAPLLQTCDGGASGR
jgi:hypothetical protein